MRICVIDGNEIGSRDMLHDVLSEGLNLPKWYGRNLDALYDCLTDLNEEVEIRFEHVEALDEHLGNYGKALMKAVHMAAEDNASIQVRCGNNDRQSRCWGELTEE